MGNRIFPAHSATGQARRRPERKKRKWRGTRTLVGFVAFGVLALSGCASPHTVDRPASALHVDSGVAVVKQELTPAQSQALAPVPPAAVHYSANKDLSPDQQAARFKYLDSNYAVGEAFSAEDAEFVRAYAQPNMQLLEPTEISVNAAASYSFDVTCNSGTSATHISGTMKHGGGPLNWTWTLSMKSATGSAITQQQMHAHPRSYGLINTSGQLGLLYSADPKSGIKTVHTYTWGPSDTYQAILEAYFQMYVTSNVSYPAGSYVCSSVNLD